MKSPFIIQFTTELADAAPSQSYQEVRLIVQETADYKKRLDDFLKESGLENQVRQIANLDSLGCLGIECEDEVAKRIEELPFVKTICKDGPMKIV
jgi:hypothetical protein